MSLAEAKNTIENSIDKSLQKGVFSLAEILQIINALDLLYKSIDESNKNKQH